MTHWRDSAACRDRPDLADVWVGDDVDPRAVGEAKAICATCPVIAACDREAVSYGPHSLAPAGVWAGKSDADRRRHARSYNMRARVCRHVSCGERAEYDRGQLCAAHHGELSGGAQRDRILGLTFMAAKASWRARRG